MKKTLKILVVVAFLMAVLLGLTGCGNKLVATRESEELGQKVKEKIEVSFKKDKINKVKMTYTFDKKETAEQMKSLFSLGMSMSGEDSSKFDIKQSGKKLIITLDAKAFGEFASESEASMTKAELKQALEEEGYKVK